MYFCSYLSPLDDKMWHKINFNVRSHVHLCVGNDKKCPVPADCVNVWNVDSFLNGINLTNPFFRLKTNIGLSVWSDTCKLFWKYVQLFIFLIPKIKLYIILCFLYLKVIINAINFLNSYSDINYWFKLHSIDSFTMAIQKNRFGYQFLQDLIIDYSFPLRWLCCGIELFFAIFFLYPLALSPSMESSCGQTSFCPEITSY